MRVSRTFYNKPVFWIWFLIIYNCVYRGAASFLSLPDAMAYLSDIAWIILGLALVTNRAGILSDAKNVRVLLIALFAQTLIGYCVNIYNPLVYLWGFRTFFRYIIFFLACVRFLRLKDIDGIFHFLCGMLFVNALFCAVEFAMGYGLDSVSGLYTFGRSVRGGAAGLNALMCIACIWLLIEYLFKNISLHRMVVPILLCMLMAALSEQKAFYIQFVLILLLCIFLTRFSLKKLVILIAGAALLVVGYLLYSRYYSGRIDLLSVEALMKYAGFDGSSYGSHSLNRFTALPYVLANILTTPAQKLFGLGLGYGDNVKTELISSGFCEAHSDLGYQYFFTSLEGVNIGILGLLLFYGFLLAVFLYARKREKNSPKALRKYFVLSQALCVMTVFFTLYNQSLILDISGFNIYFSLAIPFIAAKCQPVYEKR